MKFSFELPQALLTLLCLPKQIREPVKRIMPFVIDPSTKKMQIESTKVSPYGNGNVTCHLKKSLSRVAVSFSGCYIKSSLLP